MAKEPKFSLTALTTKATGTQTKSPATASTCGQMAAHTEDPGPMGKWTAKVSISGGTGGFMSASIGKIRRTGMECTRGLMGGSTMGLGRKEPRMVLGCTCSPLASSAGANGRTAAAFAG